MAIFAKFNRLAKKQSDVFIPYYGMTYRLLMMPLTYFALEYFKTQRLKTVLQLLERYSLEIYVLQLLMIGVAQKALILMNCPLYLIPTLYTLLL